MIDLLSMDQKDMEVFVTENGFPKFRGKQLYQWIHQKEIFHFEEMTNLPRALITFLMENTEIKRGEKLAESVSSNGETVKFLLRFGDELIETVMMHYSRKNSRDRNTLCVSTQAGCAMGCKFCATGQGGLVRDLSCGEIVAQFNFANEYLRSIGERPVSNIVYMGMGEPLANYDATLKSIRILNDAKEIGMRRITVSTCGLIPEIRELEKEDMQLTLAISLH
ncbi:MAG: 23S rRNA (adenine(2503)-C(2))-methyltransferase RlmN, partial [Firmicutes bacterium]|nr:23S rRNA (adenine(2503)-C(2))-methyltransferase RlmN [Bacillota bacterium]